MKKIMIWAGVITGVAVIAVAIVAAIKIGPRNIWGMIRYDQRREGDLAVGDPGPDVVLTALDGVKRVRLHEEIDRLGAKDGKPRPTVLIFGSYT